jgi:hypothetical protein
MERDSIKRRPTINNSAHLLDSQKITKNSALLEETWELGRVERSTFWKRLLHIGKR